MAGPLRGTGTGTTQKAYKAGAHSERTLTQRAPHKAKKPSISHAGDKTVARMRAAAAEQNDADLEKLGQRGFDEEMSRQLEKLSMGGAYDYRGKQGWDLVTANGTHGVVSCEEMPRRWKGKSPKSAVWRQAMHKAKMEHQAEKKTARMLGEMVMTGKDNRRSKGRQGYSKRGGDFAVC